MNSYKYCVVDVFTNERFKGNPLAVVFTDTDLKLPTYENMAREFGYSETSFIYYSKKDKALKVRSFTPTCFEIHGAGHNLLGAVGAALLTGMKIFAEQEQKEWVIMKDQIIPLSTDLSDKNLPFVGMLQSPAVIERTVDPEIIASSLTLHKDDLIVDALAPVVVKTEVTHLMIPVKNIEKLNNCIPNKTLLMKATNKYGFEGVYCFTILNKDPQYFAQTRFFNPGVGIDEDPATGSAAGPLAGLLFEHKYIQLDTVYQLLQGVKMNQPSVIKFEVKNEGIWISGSAIIVMEGIIHE